MDRPPVARIDLSGYVVINLVSKACLGRYVRIGRVRQIEEEASCVVDLRTFLLSIA